MRQTMTFSSIAQACVLAMLSAGCASGSMHTSELSLERAAPSNEPARYGRPSDVLTAAELSQARALSTADGVRQLRPTFLQATRTIAGGSIVAVAPAVFMNGAYIGGVDALETVTLGAVDEIRFIRPVQAHDFWGSSCPCNGGVIHVRTKRTGDASPSPTPW